MPILNPCVLRMSGNLATVLPRQWSKTIDHPAVGPCFPSSPICQGVHQRQGDFAGAGGATKLSVTSVLNPFMEISKKTGQLDFWTAC
jgi:hypothetical protein